jgi:hypothetical protein
VFESGPSPAFTPSTDTHSAQDDEKEGGSKGLLMALGLVMLLGVGFMAYKFIGGGGDATTPVTKGEPKGDPPAKVEPKDPVKAVTPPDPTGAVIDPPPDPSAGDPPDPPDPTGTAVDPPIETPTKKTPPIAKTTPKKDTPKKDTPTEPRGDPGLLDDARKASLANNATQAYELAKKSYDIDKNVAALQLMGVSACKMGDHTKAKSAYKKLEASRQKQLQAVCAEKGITLE